MDRHSPVLVSSVSLWEIGLKSTRGSRVPRLRSRIARRRVAKLMVRLRSCVAEDIVEACVTAAEWVQHERRGERLLAELPPRRQGHIHRRNAVGRRVHDCLLAMRAVQQENTPLEDQLVALSRDDNRELARAYVRGIAAALHRCAVHGLDLRELHPAVPAVLDHASATLADAVRGRRGRTSEARVREEGMPIAVLLVEHAGRERRPAQLRRRLRERVRGVAPGQAMVVYDGTRVVGSVTITRSTRAARV